jgi:hypothetical protein
MYHNPNPMPLTTEFRSIARIQLAGPAGSGTEYTVGPSGPKLACSLFDQNFKFLCACTHDMFSFLGFAPRRVPASNHLELGAEREFDL